MVKRPKVKRFSIQSYDMAHYKTTDQYTKFVGKLFDTATKAITQAAAKGTYNPDKPFSFDDYPKVKGVLQKETEKLASQMTTAIESGSKKQWLFACKKNDGFIASIMDTSKLKKSTLNKMQDRNLDALATFQQRKVDGMDLSQRVWKYVGQYKEQMQDALDVGLGEGKSAQELARDVKQNLQEPNRLFRRVRDKRGNLVLSKNAKAYHPGQGVYRSSVKNAQRLTRSEINMAYRESDWQRWQTLDFVVGFEICRSNHDPLPKCDLCEKLKGKYPKSFKFKGWHPQCMCYCIPILADEETFDENELGDLKAALHGTTYEHKAAKNTVLDVPQAFKDWVDEHKDAQDNWGSTPYFIKDNFVDGDLTKGLRFEPLQVKQIVENAVASESGYVPFMATTIQEATDFILNNIADSITMPLKKADLPLINEVMNQVAERMQQFGLSKFGNIGVPSHRQAEASWDAFGNTLNFNMSAFRTKSAIKRAQAYKKRGILYSHAYEDEADYVRSVVDHELGHLILSKFGNMKDVAKLLGECSRSIIVNGKPFNPIGDVLGYYATTEEHEFFAEAFSFYMGKNREHLDDRIKAHFEQLFNKKGFMLDKGKNAPKIDPVQEELDAMAAQVATVRALCLEWGITTTPLDSSLSARNPQDVRFALSFLTDKVNIEKHELNAYLADAQATINEANTNSVDAKAVVNDVMKANTNKREWVANKAAFKQRVEELKKHIIASKTKIQTSIDSVKDKGVEYRKVGMHKEQPTETELIANIGGGDQTEGSCSSLAFTWAANRGGMNVLDFRDGESRKFFATKSNIRNIVEKLGGKSEWDTTGMQLVSSAEIGKEYYVAWGKHAAIVRKIKGGKYEYLELQSGNTTGYTNGWHPLNAEKFKWRFGWNGKTWGCIIEIGALSQDSGYKELMGYINTQKSKQVKGTTGTIK